MEEIFKKSFLEGFASGEIGSKQVAVALLTAFVISMYIFYVNRMVTRKTFYSKNFGMSLVGVSLITTTIIITIQSSIVVSLGMVGALSIVRFRTAIKDPMDLMFLFWSISIGIVCGAGFAEFGVLLSLAMTVALFILEKLPVAKAPMILVINSDDVDIEKQALEIIGKFAKHYTVKSRNLSHGQLDLTIELRTDNGSDLTKELIELKGITSVNLLKHDGEVTF